MEIECKIPMEVNHSRQKIASLQTKWEEHECAIKEITEFLKGKILYHTEHLTCNKQDHGPNIHNWKQHLWDAHWSTMGCKKRPVSVQCEDCVTYLKKALDFEKTKQEIVMDRIKLHRRKIDKFMEEQAGESRSSVEEYELEDETVPIWKLDYGVGCKYNGSLYMKVNKKKRYQNYTIEWTNNHCLLMNLKLGTIRAVKASTLVEPVRIVIQVFPPYESNVSQYLKDMAK